MKNHLAILALSFCASIVLPIPSFAALPDCMKSTSDIEQALNDAILKANGSRIAVPNSIILDNQIEMASDRSRRRLFFEGFIHPDKSFVRLIPNLGLGVEASKRTVIYICLRMDGTSPTNELLLHGLDVPFAPVGTRYDSRPMRLTWRGLSDDEFFFAAFFEYFGLGKLEKPIGRTVETTIKSLFAPFFGVGTGRVHITPQEITLYTSTVILTGIATPPVVTRIKYKSEWLRWR